MEDFDRARAPCRDTTTSGPLGGEPSKRRRPWRLWQVVTGLSIVLVAFAVFASQQGGDGHSGPLNAIAAAAERTQGEPGGRATSVPTTRYRGTVGVSENAERLREEGAEGLASYFEEEGTPLRVEAWIDADGLVRRMRIVKSEPREEGEGSVTMDMRIDFFDFGIVPEIDVPEPSEVFDATALARDELGLANDG